MESLRSSLESCQGQNTELQYQLREAQDRIALMQDEFTDSRRDQDLHVQSSGPSTEEVTRLLAAAESKYEAKLGDLRRRLAEAERERDDGEAHWSKKLAERAREVESLKAKFDLSLKSKEEELESAQVLKKQIDVLQGEIKVYQQQVADLHVQSEKAVEIEVNNFRGRLPNTLNTRVECGKAPARRSWCKGRGSTASGWGGQELRDSVPRLEQGTIPLNAFPLCAYS